MKTLSIIAFLIAFSSFLKPQNTSQNSLKLLIVSEKVGEKIELSEREFYHLMPSIKNFWSASFYISPKNLVYAKIETRSNTGDVLEIVQDYPLTVLFRMAEKINNFEELSAGRYLSGEDVITLQVVGGESITWSPTLPTKDNLKKIGLSESKSDAEFKSIDIDTTSVSPFKGFELRISSGYGFAKGGPPLRNFHEVRTYGNTTPSYREIKDSKDEYFSLGMGTRFEGQVIYYVHETIGLFVEVGYSFGNIEQAISTTSSFDYYPPSLYSDERISRQTFRFNTMPIIVGIHFRDNSIMFNSYGGVGVGLWFPPNLSVNFQEKYGASNYERDLKMELNTPVGYSAYFGIAYPLNMTIDFFIEGKTSLATFYVQRTEITKYRVNDKDRLSDLTTHDKVTVYEENRNYKESPIYDSKSPQFGGPPYPVVAGNVSLVAGIAFKL